MMRELAELQNGRLWEGVKLMSTAFKGSSSQQFERQEKHHSPDHNPPKRTIFWSSGTL